MFMEIKKESAGRLLWEEQWFHKVYKFLISSTTTHLSKGDFYLIVSRGCFHANSIFFQVSRSEGQGAVYAHSPDLFTRLFSRYTNALILF